MGVAHTTISRLERGKVELTDTYLQELADAIGCDPVELVSDKPVAATDAQAEVLKAMATMDEPAVAALLAAAKAMAKR